MNKLILNDKQKKTAKKTAITASAIGGAFIIKLIDKTGLGEKLCDLVINKLVYLKGTKFGCQYYDISWYNKDIPDEVITKILEFTNETLEPYIKKI